MNKIVSLADNSAVYDVAKVTPLSIAVQKVNVSVTRSI